MALQPRLLLLDEPWAGVAQRETEALAELLIRVKAELGATLMVVEHNIPLVTAIADRMALVTGTILAFGNPQDVLDHPDVATVFLGQPIAIDRPTPRSAGG